MDEIIISGNKVSLRNVQEIKNLNVEDFYGKLSMSVGVRTPILPEKVICYAAKENTHIYMTHLEPCTVTLNVKLQQETKVYDVKLPHIYFFHTYVNLAFDRLHVFGSNTKVYGTEDILCRLPFRNLYCDCRVCQGNGLTFELEGSLMSKICKVEKHFWDSTFNRDLDTVYLASAPKEWAGKGDPIEYWSDLSKDENFDACEVEWINVMSCSRMIDKILKE